MQYGIYTPNFGAEISARALAARLILTVGLQRWTESLS